MSEQPLIRRFTIRCTEEEAQIIERDRQGGESASESIRRTLFRHASVGARRAERYGMALEAIIAISGGWSINSRAIAERALR